MVPTSHLVEVDYIRKIKPEFYDFYMYAITERGCSNPLYSALPQLFGKGPEEHEKNCTKWKQVISGQHPTFFTVAYGDRTYLLEKTGGSATLIGLLCMDK